MSHFFDNKQIAIETVADDLAALPDCTIEYYPDFLNRHQADQVFNQLYKCIPWQQDQIRMFGKWVRIPRQQAWFGDTDAEYTYSGLTLAPRPFPEPLLHLKQDIEAICGHNFNAVLANLYRDGKDSMGWHSDNEKELGNNPVIASISLGTERRFQLKHRSDPSLKYQIPLAHGSLLIMKGATQHHWLHGIPKQAKIDTARINLTFRRIFSE